MSDTKKVYIYVKDAIKLICNYLKNGNATSPDPTNLVSAVGDEYLRPIERNTFGKAGNSKSIYQFNSAHNIFSKDDIIENFKHIIKNEAAAAQDRSSVASTASLILPQIQGDFISMLQRAQNEKNKTIPRRIAHACGLMRVCGNEGGVFDLGIKREITESQR